VTLKRTSGQFLSVSNHLPSRPWFACCDDRTYTEEELNQMQITLVIPVLKFKPPSKRRHQSATLPLKKNKPEIVALAKELKEISFKTGLGSYSL